MSTLLGLGQSLHHDQQKCVELEVPLLNSTVFCAHRIIALMNSKPLFIGTDTHYPTADGESRMRSHLDGAASPLAAQLALETIQKLLPHYSNSHSYVHSSAQISTQAQAWAHDQILESLGADKQHYTAILLGSGTTAGINRVARGLAKAQQDRSLEKNIVLVSAMEHHANDLPHRQFGNQVIYIPLQNDAADNSNNNSKGRSSDVGAIDLSAFEALCKEHANNLNYVALSSVSNVTGISNPVNEICEIAHRYGALVLIDGAQQVAHRATKISESDVDFFVFSGHKVYTPMSPGVLIAKKSVLADLSGQDLGGGSVASVSYFDFQFLSDYPEKEQSGTPNIVGAVALARVLKSLSDYGFDTIEAHASKLMQHLIDGLKSINGVRIYGDPELARIGALAFNHSEIDHGLLAAILNDYYAIAVRNECFCAHPYVSSLLKEELWELDLDGVPEDQQESLLNRKRGMVRASISLYNSISDIERLLTAIKDIGEQISRYQPLYSAQPDGSYTHNSFELDWQAQLEL